MEKFVQNQVVKAIETSVEVANESWRVPKDTLPFPVVELPKRAEWGDLSSNIAMILASAVRKAPLKIAEELADLLRERFAGLFLKINVAPPGFLNLTLHPLRWIEVLHTVEKLGVDYGKSQLGKGKRINLEFVSANPTGPLHVGHGRGAALGQAMASLLSTAGFDVTREFYINDAGRQMQLLGRSVYARYCELLGRKASFPEDGYHGDYIKALAKAVLHSQGGDLIGEFY